VANRKKTSKPRKPQHHLPKVGSPADDVYRLRRSREDVVDFGLTRARGRGMNVVLAVIAILVLALGVISLIVLTA
jgi:hypothetical protein